MKVEKEEAHELTLVSPENKSDSTETVTKTESETQEEFDWQTDPAVILHDQAAVAAYFNKFGELVVKQRDTLGYEAVVFVAPENVEKFVHGLRDRALPATPKKLRVVEGGANE
jgi:hypothetical protein